MTSKEFTDKWLPKINLATKTTVATQIEFTNDFYDTLLTEILAFKEQISVGIEQALQEKEKKYS